jgi:uncharacterized protein
VSIRGIIDEAQGQLPEVALALLNPGIYPDKADRVELVQTQMSFVFLAGNFAYKVKKPVNLGYLDYTSLAKRRFYCEQEVALNSRLCPEFYLGVVPITRSGPTFSIAGQGEVIDYAVKMNRLPQDCLMNVLLDRDRVSVEMIEKLARKIAAFHFEAETNSAIQYYGQIETIRFNTDENFSQTEKYIGTAVTAKQYRRIKDYTRSFLREKAELFEQRVADGRIRDGHGDLYTQHICFCDGICVFDCIEFNERFRYGDVAVDVAFLAMDLDHYGRADLSRSFIEAYIRAGGDEQLEELLKFYKCYRAYVRGKVECFNYDDPYVTAQEKEQAREAARGYFELADSYARSRPSLFITVGLVGSGKTTLAKALARRLGLTVISSDAVRKKLASIPATEHRFEEMESGIYAPDFSRRTYDKMLEEAEKILGRGDPVILDASFIKAEERSRAQKLAAGTGADFAVLECRLNEEETRRRLDKRLRESSVSDGTWQVYEFQKGRFEPVTEVPPEQHFVIESERDLGKQITAIIESEVFK